MNISWPSRWTCSTTDAHRQPADRGPEIGELRDRGAVRRDDHVSRAQPALGRRGMLRPGRCRLDVSIGTLMMIDSLEMTDADREIIVRHCAQSDESPIVIAHGTDTMVETATALARGVTGKIP
jgi:L-asparaginase/Glu-tRNA(Gln) amidotransferase subunit D